MCGMCSRAALPALTAQRCGVPARSCHGAGQRLMPSSALSWSPPPARWALMIGSGSMLSMMARMSRRAQLDVVEGIRWRLGYETLIVRNFGDQL